MTQQNLVTRAQLLSMGETISSIKWALRIGRLKGVRPGVYAIAGVDSQHQALMAACLAAGPSAAASHLAAAALYGAEQVLADRVEITVFGNGVHRLPGVIMHRSRIEVEQATTKHLGVPIVLPPLAVAQVGATWDLHLVKSIANDLVKRNWTDFTDILGWVDKIGDRRWQPLRELCLEAIAVGGHRDSPAARGLALSLKRAGVEPFELDYQVVTPGGVLLIDIAWPAPKVGLEYNGARDHDGPLALCDDARRRGRLAAVGWRMLDARRGMSDEEIVTWVKGALSSQPQTGQPQAG